ncbi:MAG: hypothetical protein QF733_00850 [Phycisphaerales bacterium]|jgi:hypothetical protein|nr:hypothetical protein [Phycisphaerales bacterium]
MRWWVLLVLAIIAVGLDSGLMGVFTLRGLGHATPSASACLITFVALQARPRAALWAAWVIGCMLDLSPSSGGGVGTVAIVGPNALGAVAATQVVLLLRPVVFRRRVITMAVVSGLAAICLGLGAATVETVRWWMPWTHALAPPPAGPQVVTIGFSGLYTMLVGLPIGAMLLGTSRFWRFDAPAGQLDYAGARR